MQVCDLYESWDVCVGSWIVRTLLVVVFVVVVVVPEVIRGCSRSGSSRRDFLLIYFIYPLINQANSHWDIKIYFTREPWGDGDDSSSRRSTVYLCNYHVIAQSNYFTLICLKINHIYFVSITVYAETNTFIQCNVIKGSTTESNEISVYINVPKWYNLKCRECRKKLKALPKSP